MRTNSNNEPVYGHIEDYEIGSTFNKRKDAFYAGVHRRIQHGICGTSEGAESIVVAGGYTDKDYGDKIIYTGEGGRDKNTGKQVYDQELIRGNAGLVSSQFEGFPVRVIRGWRGDKVYSPKAGYRYDGLYQVVDHWKEIGVEGFAIWRFLLVALPKEISSELVVDASGDLTTSQASGQRAWTVVNRPVRDKRLVQKVKNFHGYTCQICGGKLATPAGAYAEAAHIRALGTPHNGPDELPNMLCLCPNHHVLFDTGSIVVNEHGVSYDIMNKAELSELRWSPKHKIDFDHFAYHRKIHLH